jgi:hypothetical protein
MNLQDVGSETSVNDSVQTNSLSLTISNSLHLYACVINHFTSCEPLIGNKEFVFYIPDKLKIFEKILEQQLSDFFENIFNPYTDFCQGHSASPLIT